MLFQPVKHARHRIYYYYYYYYYKLFKVAFCCQRYVATNRNLIMADLWQE